MPVLRPDSEGAAMGACSGREGLLFALAGGACLAVRGAGFGAGRAGAEATLCSRVCGCSAATKGRRLEIAWR